MTLATDIDGKVAMEIGYVSYGRMWPDGCESLAV